MIVVLEIWEKISFFVAMIWSLVLLPFSYILPPHVSHHFVSSNLHSLCDRLVSGPDMQRALRLTGQLLPNVTSATSSTSGVSQETKDNSTSLM